MIESPHLAPISGPTVTDLIVPERELTRMPESRKVVILDDESVRRTLNEGNR